MFHVMYLQKNEKISVHLSLGQGEPNENELHNFYKVVRVFRDTPEDVPEFLEKIFTEMQAENWSPAGEQRELIGDLDLHTSMSVGDIVYDDKTQQPWICLGTGFKALEVKDLGTGEVMDKEALVKVLPLDNIHPLVREVYIDQPPLSPVEQWYQEGQEDWSF